MHAEKKRRRESDYQVIQIEHETAWNEMSVYVFVRKEMKLRHFQSNYICSIWFKFAKFVFRLILFYLILISIETENRSHSSVDEEYEKKIKINVYGNLRNLMGIQTNFLVIRNENEVTNIYILSPD